MNPRTLRIFAVIAVLGLAVAWWASTRNSSTPVAEGAGDAFLPGLEAGINDVARIEIDDGATPIRYERRDARWVDAERGGYPAQADEIKRLLLGLYGLEKREAKTARPERHAELKLATTGEVEGRGKVLRLWKEGAEAPSWELVIGEAKYTPVRGVYVRLANEDQTWFAGGEVPLPYQPTAWLDKEVANVNQTDIAGIVLVRGENSFTIARADAEAPWTLAELPEGRSLKEFAPFGSLGNTLGYLNFEDVAPAGEERFTRGPDVVAEYSFFNGGSIRLEGWKLGDEAAPEVWVRVASSQPTEIASDENGDSQAESRPPSAATLSQWESKWHGWVYKLPQWKGSALLQGVEDWLEPLPVEEPPVEEPPIVDVPVEDDGQGG